MRVNNINNFNFSSELLNLSTLKFIYNNKVNFNTTPYCYSTSVPLLIDVIYRNYYNYCINVLQFLLALLSIQCIVPTTPIVYWAT